MQAEAEREQRQFKLRKLELQRREYPSVPARRDVSPQFQIEKAICRIPKFDGNDIETFLISISFQKVASLNNFPRDKYAAILQAHLTGKALRVFTELSTDECQHCLDYPTLKNVFLTAFAVVPEVYRQRFRASAKTRSETYSEFAFHLTTQFKRWCESMNAYSDIAVMRKLTLMEQLTTHLEAGMRGWLAD